MSHSKQRDSKGSPKHAKPTNRWTILVAILISLVFTFSGSVFPRDYALCTRSNDIYTVDETRPRVQCIVVRGSRIFDTGDQGQCVRRSGNFWSDCFPSVNVQRRWSEEIRSKLLTRAVHLMQGGLKIIHVKPGSIVVPGLAGPFQPHVLSPQLMLQQTLMLTSLNMALRCNCGLTGPSLLTVSYSQMFMCSRHESISV
jgi:hypothetical protein